VLLARNDLIFPVHYLNIDNLDRPASVADIVVGELRKKEINGPILPKRDFFTRGQKLKVKEPVAHSLRLRSGIRRHVDT
jgi:hypothetical protein